MHLLSSVAVNSEATFSLRSILRLLRQLLLHCVIKRKRGSVRTKRILIFPSMLRFCRHFLSFIIFVSLWKSRFALPWKYSKEERKRIIQSQSNIKLHFKVDTIDSMIISESSAGIITCRLNILEQISNIRVETSLIALLTL